jgi:hypothetical protein
MSSKLKFVIATNNQLSIISINGKVESQEAFDSDGASKVGLTPV